MRRIIILFVILALAACTIAPLPTEPGLNTDAIAGIWIGEVTGNNDSGDELPPRDIQIIIIPGCSAGNVCGKLAEDGQCPGDIILMQVDGNRYKFLSETVGGVLHICGMGEIRTFELKLRSDGMVDFAYHNGATIRGIFQKK